MRLNRLQENIKQEGQRAFLLQNPSNLFYLAEIPKTCEGRLLVTESKSFYLTDSRFSEEAKNFPVDQVVLEKQDKNERLLALLEEEVGSSGEIALDSDVDLGDYFALKEFGDYKFCLSHLPEKMRQIKEQVELEHLRASARLVEQTFLWLQEEDLTSLSERELAWKIEEHLRHALGAEGLAFPILIGSGANGAVPHAFPSEKKIKKNELVVVDFGAILHGYCSDATRTFFTGKLDRKEHQKEQEMHQAVRRAQERALETIAPGVKLKDIDRAAREVLKEAGLGKYFTHSTGHGIGIDVHEEPALRPGYQEKIEAGNVVTVEPGVYVPGLAGVRIEDTVIVHEQGIENLSPMPKAA